MLPLTAEKMLPIVAHGQMSWCRAYFGFGMTLLSMKLNSELLLQVLDRHLG